MKTVNRDRRRGLWALPELPALQRVAAKVVAQALRDARQPIALDWDEDAATVKAEAREWLTGAFWESVWCELLTREIPRPVLARRIARALA